jgi:TPR repeat protein
VLSFFRLTDTANADSELMAALALAAATQADMAEAARDLTSPADRGLAIMQFEYVGGRSQSRKLIGERRQFTQNVEQYYAHAPGTGALCVGVGLRNMSRSAGYAVGAVGEGEVDVNLTEAVRYYKMPANRGHAENRAQYGVMRKKGTESREMPGRQ